MIATAGQGVWVTPARGMRPSEALARPADTQPAGDDLPAGEEPPPRPQPFHLNVADLYIGMESEYEYRRVHSESKSRRNAVQTNRDFRIHEIAGISLTGDVYDPGFIDYHANLEFGLTQARYVETINRFSQSEDDSGTLMEFDIGLDAFKAKPISISTYARRTQDRIPRRFLPSLREWATEAGASVLAITGPVTTEIGYTYRDVERTGNRLNEDDESLNLNRCYIDSKWQISPNQSLNFSYDHEREENKYQGSWFGFDQTRDEIRLDHELAFGPGERNRLDTFLRYNEEEGDLDRSEFEFVPRLTLHHSDKLQTVYRYSFYRVAQEALDIAQHKFDWQALYQATPDLRLSLNPYALYEDVDKDVQTREYGVNGEATYTRATPWGQFFGDLNLGWDGARTTGTAGRRYVRNEAHALGGVRPVFLRERGVIPSTIIAHDARYQRIYILGVDYLITYFQGRVSLFRLPFGRIAENEVVYFDYQYEVPADASVDTYRIDLRLEHAFACGLTPYYYWESRFQHVGQNSIGAPYFRDNQNRHRLGLRYGKERWNVTGEYEIFDDSVEPFHAWHLTGMAQVLRSAPHTLDLTAELSRYQFEGWPEKSISYWGWNPYGSDRRRVWYFDIDLRDHMEVTQWLSLEAGAELRRECDSVRGNTTGVDAEAGVKYVRGYLTVELEVEYDLLNIIENREDGVGIFLNIRRDLSHLLPCGREAEQ